MTAPRPQGNYRAVRLHDGVLYVAGMTPRDADDRPRRGIVGVDLDRGEARDAAATAAERAIAAIRSALPDGARVSAVLRLVVYIAAAPGFTEHSAVADGASDRLAAAFGGDVLGARTAVGVVSLPGGAPVEVEVTTAVTG